MTIFEPAMFEPWSVIAANLPEHADNAIHTDDGARAAGFDGALVAGVTTYAYLTHVPATAWGRSWLSSGGADVRFLHPVMDGDRVDLVRDDDGDGDGDGDGEHPQPGRVVASVAGEVKVRARFTERGEELADRSGSPLEPIEFVLDASWSDYGFRAGDDCPLYADLGVAHPTSWPRLANRFCHEQLVDGAWIHVRSRIAHHGLARVGATIRATAVVADRFDSRAGERAVLDVRISSDGSPVASVEHEAIIDLRP
ncbi:MAG: hypothetical protein ABJH68_13105 [Ilumatobacter sp.]|uniref:hypothetical protein n=1 Tax=Ilumatobacter sp. TaxID=1967498 RepID=UPI003297D5F2